MKAETPIHLTLAVILALFAGLVDATGFALLGGLFVSFMSGNTTRLGAFLAEGDVGEAAEAGGLVLAFVFGSGLGYGLARAWGREVVLFFEAALLAAAAVTSGIGGLAVAGFVMAVAMGVENAILSSESGQYTNVTFVTGALVKLGQGVVAAAMGGPRWGWTRHLLLWLGLLAGATIGTLLYARIGLSALFVPSAGLALIAAGLTLFDADEDRAGRGP